MPPYELLGRLGLLNRLTLNGQNELAELFAENVTDQDQRLAGGESVSHIPLLWRSLAELVGLTVTDSGRIVDGPHIPDEQMHLIGRFTKEATHAGNL